MRHFGKNIRFSPDITTVIGTTRRTKYQLSLTHNVQKWIQNRYGTSAKTSDFPKTRRSDFLSTTPNVISNEVGLISDPKSDDYADCRTGYQNITKKA